MSWEELESRVRLIVLMAALGWAEMADQELERLKLSYELAQDVH